MWKFLRSSTQRTHREALLIFYRNFVNKFLKGCVEFFQVFLLQMNMMMVAIAHIFWNCSDLVCFHQQKFSLCILNQVKRRHIQTNGKMMMQMFYLQGFSRWTNCTCWVVKVNQILAPFQKLTCITAIRYENNKWSMYICSVVFHFSLWFKLDSLFSSVL